MRYKVILEYDEVRFDFNYIVFTRLLYNLLTKVSFLYVNKKCIHITCTLID